MHIATTKIWKVTNKLEPVISYVSNKAKTNNEKYVTEINCLPQTAMHEMNIVKQQFNKTDGIIGYHAYQSFSGYK